MIVVHSKTKKTPREGFFVFLALVFTSFSLILQSKIITKEVLLDLSPQDTTNDTKDVQSKMTKGVLSDRSQPPQQVPKNHPKHEHAPERPEIAWLLSYPNSGTSFTMQLVERATNLSTATNYGREVVPSSDSSSIPVPLHSDHPEGPYWDGLSGKMGPIRDLPESFVLTKTHCGGRCVRCGASMYVVDTDDFLKGCQQTSTRIAPTPRHNEGTDSSSKKIISSLSADRVTRVVHLVRSPFDNTVARYHMERKHALRDNKTFYDDFADAAAQRHLWALEPNSTDATGFRWWCAYEDARYKKDEEQHTAFSESLLAQMRRVPCRGEFYKYTQWHNRVFDILPRLGLAAGSSNTDGGNIPVPALAIHYEDYQNKYNETLHKLVDFLDQPIVGRLHRFRPLPNYRDHYTLQDRQAIKSLVQSIATEPTWELLQRYFEE